MQEALGLVGIVVVMIAGLVSLIAMLMRLLIWYHERIMIAAEERALRMREDAVWRAGRRLGFSDFQIGGMLHQLERRTVKR